MNNITGRIKEQEILKKKFDSRESEFIAIYGRRRVGKTFLIKNVFEKKGIYIESTGEKDASYKEQLFNYIKSIEKVFSPDIPIKTPTSWKEAFAITTVFFKKQPRNKKIILFLDELPWMANKRSGLIQSLDYYWNMEWSRINNLILIVCGSAASWVIDNLINARGGLHNRLTKIILLEPFSLGETKYFLINRGIKLQDMQILELYLTTGGIPQYLKQIEKGKSAYQNINDMCFKKDGYLFDEYSRLFASLFNHSDMHEKIISNIAQKPEGISRRELLKKTGKYSGGTFNKHLRELQASGFIEIFIPFGKKKKNYTVKIIDEYTIFYHNWIKEMKNKKMISQNKNYWITLMKEPKWQAWAGYAFESVCYKHIWKIIKALQIEQVSGEIGSWRFIPKKGSQETGAQIDLLIDRADDSITICEIKFSKYEYLIDKKYAKSLLNKIEMFEKHFPHKKQIFLSMITTKGIKPNIYSEYLIMSQVLLEDLF